MYIYVSTAISLDGYIDDSSSERLILSNSADFEHVKQLRAIYDAVLVGAETIRRDNPALVTRDEELAAKRIAAGLPRDPVKVTVSVSGNIDSHARFFTEGDCDKIVIVAPSTSIVNIERLSSVAKVIVASQDDITPELISDILEGEGITSLFIEGGSKILTQFLCSNKVDYLRLAVAPFFVGDSNGKRFVDGCCFTFNKDHRMNLVRTYALGDMAVAEYALRYTKGDYEMLERAIDLSRSSPRSDGAYSVGAVIVTVNGDEFTGYSRETASYNHAEEEAIAKAVAQGASLKGAVIYSSMEPCSKRKSKELSCSSLIISHGMSKVVFATMEPDNFVECVGVKMLSDAGVNVVEIKDLAEKALNVNAHLKK